MEIIALEECLKSGVEKYDNIDVVVYSLSDGISWIAKQEDEIFQAQWKWVQVKDTNMYQTRQNETYVVREGDCLWSIAEEQLGDGMYWSSIYEANRELIGNDPNLINVGWE